MRTSTAVTVMGGVEVLVPRLSLLQPFVINNVTVMGGVEVLVPPGVRVEMSGLPLMRSCRNKVRQGDLPPDAPLVRVRGITLMGGIVARTTTPRRTRKT